MTGNRSSRKHVTSSTLRSLVLCVLLGLATVSIVACEKTESFTPPPATIIRASDEVVPSPTSGEKVPEPTETELPMPPTRPSVSASTEPTDYPLPNYTPGKSPTPGTYPTE